MNEKDNPNQIICINLRAAEFMSTVTNVPND